MYRRRRLSSSIQQKTSNASHEERGPDGPKDEPEILQHEPETRDDRGEQDENHNPLPGIMEARDRAGPENLLGVVRGRGITHECFAVAYIQHPMPDASANTRSCSLRPSAISRRSQFPVFRCSFVAAVCRAQIFRSRSRNFVATHSRLVGSGLALQLFPPRCQERKTVASVRQRILVTICTLTPNPARASSRCGALSEFQRFSSQPLALRLVKICTLL